LRQRKNQKKRKKKKKDEGGVKWRKSTKKRRMTKVNAGKKFRKINGPNCCRKTPFTGPGRGMKSRKARARTGEGREGNHTTGENQGTPMGPSHIVQLFSGKLIQREFMMADGGGQGGAGSDWAKQERKKRRAQRNKEKP